MFRLFIDIADSINIWFTSKLNLNPKRCVLEMLQDQTTMEELDQTIGKSLGIK